MHVIPNIPPPAALAAHIAGCAAATFQIGNDGKAFNITVLREKPADYGFGTTTIDVLSRTIYFPPHSPTKLYYAAPIFIPPGYNATIRLPPP